MAEKPAMTVRGVNDIHVAPDEWPARWGERGLGESPLRVVVVLVGVVVDVGLLAVLLLLGAFSS